LFWLSVGAGPLFGLALVVGTALIVDLVRGSWGNGAFLMLGLPFAHIFGGVPAAISAGLNIAIAKTVGSRAWRLLAAPLCGGVSGLVYLPLSETMHQRHWFILTMMTLCAVSSLICVAIHERHHEGAAQG
jgi:hypothetical protein